MARGMSAATSVANRTEAVRVLDSDEYANSSKKPRQSMWKTWCKYCAAWGIAPLPVTSTNVRAVGASLKAGQYRSADQYFSRATQEHSKQLDEEISPQTKLAIKAAIRSIERNRTITAERRVQT